MPHPSALSSAPSEFSFFDRFGQKEQTGIGGRSKVAPVVEVTPPRPQHLSPIPASHPVASYSNAPYHQSPKRLHSLPPYSPALAVPSPAAHGLPAASSGGLRSSADLSNEERMLLMGLHAESTFRTSEFLGAPILTHRSPRPAAMGRRQVVDVVSPEDGSDFLAEVERLRQSGGSSMGDTNIYGTPYSVSAAREAQLRRRPSWGEADVFYQHGSGGPPAEPPPRQENGAVDALSRHGGVRRPVEPLATQEADELQRQLQRLRRQDARGTVSFQAQTPRAPLPQLLQPQSKHVYHLEPLSALDQHPVEHHFRKSDVANLPGGMYGKPLPSLVVNVLEQYKQQHLRNSPQPLCQLKPSKVRQKKPMVASRSSGWR